MDAKRILFVTDSLVAGGIEAQLAELVTRLDRSQFDPHVACLYGPPVRPAPLASRLEAANVPLHRLSLSLVPQDKLAGVARIAALARRLHPTILQAENYHANLLCRLARPLMPSLDLIGTVRGVYSPKQLLYERFSHRFCTAIVTNAPQLVPMLARRAKIPRTKLVHIPNGIDIARFATPDDPPPGCTFLILGRISAEKNIHRTLEAFALLRRGGRLRPHVRVVIVGPVQEMEAQREIERILHGDPDLTDMVSQYPETTQPEAYFRACTVCIVYSAPVRPPAEGLPSVLLEALAAGRPVIASEVANAAGVITHGVQGWVAHDVPQLASIVEDITAMPDSALRPMRHACRVQAEQYRVGLMVERYAQLYHRILGETTAPAPAESSPPSVP